MSFNVKSNLKIGFTGTRDGMTFRQYNAFCDLMYMLSCTADEYHHGDSLGADDEFHSWILMYDNRPITIVIHPPNNSHKRAFCRFSGNLIVREEKPYLDRNRDIVAETDILVATPKEYVEVQRSGTWATIREARRQRKPVYIVYPDGEIVKQ